MMNNERRVRSVIEHYLALLPQVSNEYLGSLLDAGEIGVAIEDFCAIVYEHGIRCDPVHLSELGEVGKRIGIDSSYWERLHSDE